eukprot:TRINITY_DN3317_c0_g1_i1.p1 TRINITY_DN3317_c0_g1~~TRINITY_DN3317_c0_g1_i1.p1  ORF type:complete len:133 (+),score=13.93 TRINITY_DN3317_c0_g1_i1:467-865(+)
MLERRFKELAQGGESEPSPSRDSQRPNSSLGSMEDQLRRFVAQCSFNERQTLLFSATMPQGVIRLARISCVGSSQHQNWLYSGASEWITTHVDITWLRARFPWPTESRAVVQLVFWTSYNAQNSQYMLLEND